MKENRSPWLYQLDQARAVTSLRSDASADIAIMGGGIAGIATAFFLLKHTDKRIALLERGRIAHGATGHNAGQVVSYFERGFASLVDQFGLERAASGQAAIDGAWALIDEMYREALLDIPFSRFLGHAGLTSYEQVMLHLRNTALRVKGGLAQERLLVADDAPFLADIPAAYEPLYRIAPRAEILALLETRVPEYVAVLSFQKGVVNSALFCQEVARYLAGKYGDRFALYEHAEVKKVLLRTDHATLDVGEHEVRCDRVVLCTNGFEGFDIINVDGLAINARFHHSVRGTVGYMSGYLEPLNKEPTAISYLEDPDPSTDKTYYYLTRRPYLYGESKMNLISIGGPGFDIEDTRAYRAEHDFPDDAAAEIDQFVRRTYDPEPNKEIDYLFAWHGLMGYTRTGVRMIGYDPRNPVLMYNLGCNGIGILPSVYGGRHIADLVNGAHLEPSIFDIPDIID